MGGLLALWAVLATALGPAPEPIDPLIPQPEQTVQATVHRILDGDTIDVVMPGGAAQRVRLLNVDTPELGGPGSQGECYSRRATELLGNIIPTQATVHLWLDVEPFDPYERMLAHVWTDGGAWVNGRLLLHGAGKALVIEPNTAFSEETVGLEAVARDSGFGLWGLCP